MYKFVQTLAMDSISSNIPDNIIQNTYFPILIPADYGYAYDYLSIFEVKVKKVGGVKAIQNFTNCYQVVEQQVGTKKMIEVFVSDEYRHLVQMNIRLFELVDEVKSDPYKGKELDEQVYIRFLAKKKVQEKFFPDSTQLEQKVGYEQK